MDDDNEVLTKGAFRIIFAEGMDHLARLVNKSLVGIEANMAKQEDIVALNRRVDAIEKELRGIHQKIDAIESELREIRYQLREVDSRAEVVDLEVRIAKLEKKVGTISSSRSRGKRASAL